MDVLDFLHRLLELHSTLERNGRSFKAMQENVQMCIFQRLLSLFLFLQMVKYKDIGENCRMFLKYDKGLLNSGNEH